MITTIIIISALIALIVWACCKVSAESTPYPCRYCEKETCGDCEYWNNMTGGNNNANV